MTSACNIEQVYHQPVVWRLVGTVVENLEELRPAKVKHELRIECELLGEPERTRVVLVELTEFLALRSK